VDEDTNITDYILYSAKKIASKLWVKFIVCPTLSGYTPAKISALKPLFPVIACTESDNVFKYCNLMFWVYPHKINLSVSYEQLKHMIWEMLQLEYRWKLKWEDRILIVHSSITTNISKMINWLEVVKFKDL
jgi:pyruvate kinase